MFLNFATLTALLVSYFVGSIPTGFWFAKFFFGVDVTKHGSGNIGATNVARVLGNKKYFFLIFFLDFLKAFFCLFLINKFFLMTLDPGSVPGMTTVGNFCFYLFIPAAFLLLGNSYSIFLNFNGGKGVSTTLGILAFLFPALFAIFLLCWGIVIFLAKRVDIASLFASYMVTASYILFFYTSNLDMFLLLFFSCWLTFRHKDNLKRLFWLT